jgi:hypothetical protein
VKRARRWLFTLAAALSLFLWVWTIALWIRGSWISDDFNFQLADRPCADGRVEQRYLLGYLQGGGVWIDDFSWYRLPKDEYTMRTPWHGYGEPRAYLYATLPLIRGAGAGYSVSIRPLLDVGPFGITRQSLRLVTPPSPVHDAYIIAFPLWFPAIIFALLPICWEIGHRRRFHSRMRSQHGRCPTCGYDLRATPERCPECGTENFQRPLGVPS